MADTRFFAEHNGETVRLRHVYMDGQRARDPASFIGLAPDGTKVRAARMVEYKRQPSRHECDARCINATGRVMRCECACGGKNHGRGNG